MMNKATYTRNSSILLVLIWGLFFVSCNGRNVRTDLDTPNSGTIHISVDESFQPVIDSQIQVFEALNPKAKIIAEYKTEAECFKDLMKDSTRMIIVTRGLNKEEEKYYKDTLSYLPNWSRVAYDAVAVIINKESTDTLFSMERLKGILDGTTGDKQKAVFDGLSGSSSARFAVDSILKGKPLDPKKVFAEKNSLGVIKYIEKNKNAIGFVGVSWIGNPEDTAQISFLDKVKIVSLPCSCPDETYVKPYQANILLKRYPLVRGLYYILKENYAGLGNSFANFLQYEKGQMIFWRAYLAPSKMNFTLRTVNF